MLEKLDNQSLLGLMMSDQPNREARSQSPPRRAPKSSRGFRWKDSSNRSREQNNDRRSGLGADRDRAYRSQSPRSRRHDDRDRGGEDSRRPERRRSPRRHDREKRAPHNDEPKPRKEKKALVTATSTAGQEMIVVNINDRLGTKTAVPCLPSDTVGQLKLMVAARIGREAGQIMLKRQGERPFKDPITLEDYGISNGVQLDLEIDTGD